MIDARSYRLGIQPGDRFPVLGRPADSCSFSGCRDRYYGDARSRWPVCRKHFERLADGFKR